MTGKHTRALERIVSNPELIGLFDVVEAKMEFPLYLNGMLVAEPDFLLFSPRYFCIGEYKCNDTSGGRRKAQNQLIVANNAFYENFHVVPNLMLYVYGRDSFKADRLDLRSSEGIWRRYH